MHRVISYIFILFMTIAVLSSCIERKADNGHPWGDDIETDSLSRAQGIVTLQEIISNGEIIVATMSGPDTYYDYRGIGVGTQYMMMKRYAENIGVNIRVEMCEDTLTVMNKVREGEADVALLMIPKADEGNSFLLCGMSTEGMTSGWFVNALNESLAESLNEWYDPKMVAKVQAEEKKLLSGKLVKRHEYAYFLDRSGGVISRYDDLFKDNSSVAGCDWRLLASICYQESRFDPEAKSFAGACGLMQLMPATAEHMGLSKEDIYDAEKNVSTAARYISHLKAGFKDIADNDENTKFVLASYNGGSGHIRDAMALAKADGKNPKVWNNVAPYVLSLMHPEVYRRPEVKHGYMRGTETVDYVSSIYKRWYDYRGVIGGPDIFSSRELTVDDIVGSSSSVNSADKAVPQPKSRPAGDYSGIDRSAEHSQPTPASTQRKAKYDVE